MKPLLALVQAILLVTSLSASDLERPQALKKLFLQETVRRGLPALAQAPVSELVPYWPQLDRLRSEAESLSPCADVTLMGAWVDRHEGQSVESESLLRDGWPRPSLSLFSRRDWGRTLFEVWNPASNSSAWTSAWLAWDEKAYDPPSLVRGLQVLEVHDPSAVLGLLRQAVGLYPEDRRFLEFVLRHPEAHPSAALLLERDRLKRGGWTLATLNSLLAHSPEARPLLLQAGYSAPQLDQATERNYAYWLAKQPGEKIADGSWDWDADRDGQFEQRLIFEAGHLLTWTHRGGDSSQWILRFEQGKPFEVTEDRGGARWNLTYEQYPLVATLRYQWGSHTLVYRFPPLTQALPLWPVERFAASEDRLVPALAQQWLPLDVGALARRASSIETWEGALKRQEAFLSQGEVWLMVEDTNDDHHPDQWSYFRSGVLASVYRAFDDETGADLRELYRQGQLEQVQSRLPNMPKTEFALFPREGVQLWDSHGHGRPFDRLFSWSASEQVQAFVFSGATLPWQTMPPWESRP